MEDSILFFSHFFIRDNTTAVTIEFKVHSCLFRIISRKQLAKALICILKKQVLPLLKRKPEGKKFCLSRFRKNLKQDRKEVALVAKKEAGGQLMLFMNTQIHRIVTL